MANLVKKSNRQSPFYALALLAFAILMILALVGSHAADNIKLIYGVVVFLGLLAMAYFSVADVFLLAIFALPLLIGLDSYQINLGSILSIVVPVRELYVNPFSLVCVFLVFLALAEMLRRGFRILHVPLVYIITIAILLNAASFFGSERKLTGVVFELYFLASFAAYFLAYMLLANRKNYVKLVITVIASSAIPAMVGFIQLLGGNFLFEADSSLGRIQGSFPHSNTFGSFLFVVLTVFLVAASAIRKNRPAGETVRANVKVWNADRTVLAFILFLLTGMLVMTFSRTAWIGLALAVAAVAVLRPRTRFLIAYAGSLAIFLGMLVGKVRNRVTEAFDRHMFDSIYGRLDIWDTALFEFRRRPLTGFGMGSFEDVIKDARGKETGNVYPHNDGIRFLLEGGFVGFAGYLLYMSGAIFYALRSFLRFPRGETQIGFRGRMYLVDLKMLGAIPMLLFVIMVPVSFVEAPSMDFVYQILAWTFLGSWLGTSASEQRTEATVAD